ncbi:MAG: response regulator [Acidobacteria bacterium]|nr:MAG: response regulator [Acidobacteriota bacterium]
MLPGISESADQFGDGELHMRSQKLLIIDNSPVQCQTLSRVFRRLGYDVVTATGGVDGLTRVAEQRPDAIILDLLLPDIDGVQICRQLKQGAETNRLPVILFTGRTRVIDILHGFQAGADMFIAKGLTLMKLVNFVKALLAEHTHEADGFDVQMAMKTSQELLRMLIGAFDGIVRARLELALGLNATASILDQATKELPTGWKLQALREGMYWYLDIRQAVIQFATFVSAVFQILEQKREDIEVGHLKEAFEHQLIFFD